MTCTLTGHTLMHIKILTSVDRPLEDNVIHLVNRHCIHILAICSKTIFNIIIKVLLLCLPSRFHQVWLTFLYSYLTTFGFKPCISYM